MRKIILGLLFILTGAVNAFGQSTTVSGNVTDSGSQAWAGGTYQFQFAPNPQFPTGPYTWTGGALNKVISGTLDGSGNYSVSIPSNTSISPQGSKWILQVTPNATSPSFSTPPTTITGGTQTLNATPPAVTTPPTLFARAYADSEITGATLGSQYFNVTTSLVRVCTVVTGLVCTTWANVGSGAGGGVTGSGVANQVAFWTGASAIGGNANLTFAPSTLSFVVSGGANSLNEILAGPTQSNGIVVGGVSTGTAVTALETGSDVLIEGDTGVVLEANTSGGVTLGLAGSNTPLFFQGSTSGTFEVSTTPTASELDFGSNAKVTSAGALTVTGGTTTASEISAGANAIAVAGQSAGNGVIIDALVAGGIIDLFASGTAQLTSSAGNVIIKPAAGTGTITLGTNGSITDAGALTVSSCTGCGGLSGLTTGVIPQATSATAIGNSSPQLDNGVTTANSLTYAGSVGIAANGFLNKTATAAEQYSQFGRAGVGVPVPYFTPTATSATSSIALDLFPHGTPANFSSNTGAAWNDICSTDINADGTDFECLRMGKFTAGTQSSAVHISSAAGGTGSVRTMILQLNGGGVGIGSLPTSGAFFGGPGWNFFGNGAASTSSILFSGTVFSGGSATTTFPNVFINQGAAVTSWTTTGTEFGINAPSGFGGSYIDVHLNGGASLFMVGSGGAITAAGAASLGSVTSLASVTAAASSALGFTGRAKIASPADGILEFFNNAGTSLTRLDLGGSTSSFPALSVSGTAISTTLADGTAGGTLTAGNLPAMSACGTTSTCANTAISTNAKLIIGSAPLVSGTPSAVTISGISPAFTSSTSYKCTVSDQTAVATALFSVTYVSGSSFTITGGTALTDTVGYICAGN
jgi:trimeric autotransporter adhesin